MLPRQLHPRNGFLPENWEDFPVDDSIPDVSLWSSDKVSEHFETQGFLKEMAGVFVKEVSNAMFCRALVRQLVAFQEIDGKSLLLLHRQDVISSLGLKLGPALKIFKEVKRLQTRRNFPQ